MDSTVRLSNHLGQWFGRAIVIDLSRGYNIWPYSVRSATPLTRPNFHAPLIPACFLARVESPQRVLNMYTLHQPGCESAIACGLLRTWPRAAFLLIKNWKHTLERWQRKNLERKTGWCEVLVYKPKKITWLFDWKHQPGLAFGAMFTRQTEVQKFQPSSPGKPESRRYPAGGLIRLDYCFHGNVYKHLTAKGLPAAVIQPGVKNNTGSEEFWTRSGISHDYRDVGVFEILRFQNLSDTCKREGGISKFFWFEERFKLLWRRVEAA